jgi:hypothetical protein
MPKNKGGYTDRWTDIEGYTDRQRGDVISLFLFFQNKESRLKMNRTEKYDWTWTELTQDKFQ